MKKVTPPGTKTTGITLSESLERIQKATKLSQREISEKGGWKDQDYLSRILSQEKKGKPVPPLLMKKLNRVFEVELNGEKQFQEDAKLIDGLVADNIGLRSTVWVLLKEIAELKAHLHGTKFEVELDVLRGRTEDVVGYALSKS